MDGGSQFEFECKPKWYQIFTPKHFSILDSQHSEFAPPGGREDLSRSLGQGVRHVVWRPVGVELSRNHQHFPTIDPQVTQNFPTMYPATGDFFVTAQMPLTRTLTAEFYKGPAVSQMVAEAPIGASLWAPNVRRGTTPLGFICCCVCSLHATIPFRLMCWRTSCKKGYNTFRVYMLLDLVQEGQRQLYGLCIVALNVRRATTPWVYGL